jgi:hypothetical protein
MARRDKFQTARIKQRSAFLKLPGEVRTLIYRAALVKNTPIDLWPAKYIESNLAHPDLVERLGNSFDDANLIEWTRVRDQADLNYVRKEMSTGILATCKQVKMEATSIFWRENSFRFSGDFDWRGVRRFLVTIGPEARSRIRSLTVCPPGWLFDQVLQDYRYPSVEASKAVTAKNHPKTHMHKLLPFGNTFQHTDNVRFICEMLRSEQSLRNLDLIIPDGWSFGQLYEPDNEYPYDQTQILFDLQTLRHFCTVSVTLESGSAMLGRHNKDFLNKLDITLIAQPLSRIVAQRPFKQWPESGTISDAADVTELTIWAPPSSDDLLTGSLKIFDKTDRNDAPARGGKAVKSTCYGRRKMARNLKGFGGCRFVERYGEYCNDCNQQLKDARGTWYKHKYWCIHCKGKTGYTWKEGIEVRKISREKRVAQQAEEVNEDAWWQG